MAQLKNLSGFHSRVMGSIPLQDKPSVTSSAYNDGSISFNDILKSKENICFMFVIIERETHCVWSV